MVYFSYGLKASWWGKIGGAVQSTSVGMYGGGASHHDGTRKQGECDRREGLDLTSKGPPLVLNSLPKLCYKLGPNVQTMSQMETC